MEWNGKASKASQFSELSEKANHPPLCRNRDKIVPPNTERMLNLKGCMKIESERPSAEAPALEMGRTGRRWGAQVYSIRDLQELGSEDPLSRAQVLASIRAAKRLYLPTGAALRALRRQIDQD